MHVPHILLETLIFWHFKHAGYGMGFQRTLNGKKYHLLKVDFLQLFVPKTTVTLTHLSLASFLWDIGKQNSPRCDAAERGVPSVSTLFARRNVIEK